MGQKTKHTPGPWVVGCERVGRQTTHYITIQKSSIYFNRGVGQTEDEMRANAHLIAAAPALLEALKAIPDSALECGHKFSHTFACWNCIVKAALAQAEGSAK